jgi:hypothetical protein
MSNVAEIVNNLKQDIKNLSGQMRFGTIQSLSFDGESLRVQYAITASQEISRIEVATSVIPEDIITNHLKDALLTLVHAMRRDAELIEARFGLRDK